MTMTFLYKLVSIQSDRLELDALIYNNLYLLLYYMTVINQNWGALSILDL